MDNLQNNTQLSEIATGLWSTIRSHLMEELSPQCFSTWFSKVQASQYSEIDGLILKVPSNWEKIWIVKRYQSTLEELLSEITSEKSRITFLVDESLADKTESTTTVGNDIRPPHGDDLSKRTNEEIALIKKTESTGEFQADSSGNQASSPIKHRFLPHFTFETFIVGDSNNLAYTACRRVAEDLSCYNPLIIYGGTGLGKTHLLRAIEDHLRNHRPELNTIFVSSERFMNDLIYHIRQRTTSDFRGSYRTADIILIDDIQEWNEVKQATQIEFLNTFNDLHLSNRQIVVSSNIHPEYSGLSAPIKSRFDSGLVVEVKEPALETRIAILRSISDREKLNIPSEVHLMVANRVQSSIRQLEGALKTIVHYAETNNCSNISLEVASSALADLPTDAKEQTTIEEIIFTVTSYFDDVTSTQLLSSSRKKHIATARHLAMYLCRQLTDHSLPEIGNRFGGRDHTTVIYAINKIKNEISNVGSSIETHFRNISAKIKKAPL